MKEKDKPTDRPKLSSPPPHQAPPARPGPHAETRSVCSLPFPLVDPVSFSDGRDPCHQPWGRGPRGISWQRRGEERLARGLWPPGELGGTGGEWAGAPGRVSPWTCWGSKLRPEERGLCVVHGKGMGSCVTSWQAGRATSSPPSRVRVRGCRRAECRREGEGGGEDSPHFCPICQNQAPAQHAWRCCRVRAAPGRVGVPRFHHSPTKAGLSPTRCPWPHGSPRRRPAVTREALFLPVSLLSLIFLLRHEL